MAYNESAFEKSFIKELQDNGWSSEVLYYKTEDQLFDNFIKIVNSRNLYDENRLNSVELSSSEIQQIRDKFSALVSPCAARKIIDANDMFIKRDINSKDTRNAGKPIGLNLFNNEISGGNSIYQIAEQVTFRNGKRGDVSLLINGLPLIHIELKSAENDINNAFYQIKNYASEGVFKSGIYAFVQVFFIANDNDIKYFANPGDSNNFNSDFVFNWADLNNKKILNWHRLVSGETKLLSVPEAHELAYYYTLADKSNDRIMTLRSYQVQAIKAIEKSMQEARDARIWTNKGNAVNTGEKRRGYVWCTTGGGKTVTTYKAAENLIDKKLVDKVVFVVDRISLESQSYLDYNSFCKKSEPDKNINEIVRAQNVYDLINLIKRSTPEMMISSIQKLAKVELVDLKKDIERYEKVLNDYNKRVSDNKVDLNEIKRTKYRELYIATYKSEVKADANNNFGQKIEHISIEEMEKRFSETKTISEADCLTYYAEGLIGEIQNKNLSLPIKLDETNGKRVLFIIDEAHRSNFGKMRVSIANHFSNAMLIGFTGTPIFSKLDRNKATEDELGTEQTTPNVFGRELHAYTIANGIDDKNVLAFNLTYVNTFNKQELRRRVILNKLDIASFDECKKDETKMLAYNELDNKMSDIDIENELPNNQYDCDEHRRAVVKHIIEEWPQRSLNGKLHGLLATSSIMEAIKYFRLFRELAPELKVTALFDMSENSSDKDLETKKNGIQEIFDYYNSTYNKNFQYPNDNDNYKKNLEQRLSHRLKNVDYEKDKIDIVIVVDQLLTGFDSKPLANLYLDKVMEETGLIQAVSRTNRIYNSTIKKHGNIIFYRKPATMQQNFKDAMKIYARADASRVSVKTLDENISSVNADIEQLKSIKNSIDTKLIRHLLIKIDIALNTIRLQGFNWKEDNNSRLKISEQKWIYLREDCIRRLPNEEQKEIDRVQEFKIDANIDLTSYNEKIDEECFGDLQKNIENAKNQPKYDEYIKAITNQMRGALLDSIEYKREYIDKFIESLISGNISFNSDKNIKECFYEYASNLREYDIKTEIIASGLDFTSEEIDYLANTIRNVAPNCHNKIDVDTELHRIIPNIHKEDWRFNTKVRDFIRKLLVKYADFDDKDEQMRYGNT